MIIMYQTSSFLGLTSSRRCDIYIYHITVQYSIVQYSTVQYSGILYQISIVTTVFRNYWVINFSENFFQRVGLYSTVPARYSKVLKTIFYFLFFIFYFVVLDIPSSSKLSSIWYQTHPTIPILQLHVNLVKINHTVLYSTYDRSDIIIL